MQEGEQPRRSRGAFHVEPRESEGGREASGMIPCVAETMLVLLFLGQKEELRCAGKGRAGRAQAAAVGEQPSAPCRQVSGLLLMAW
ncbi:hypothetical protein AV530_001006 [Patagioenas fasciata monilis]|uniref:Uncharacterized protein n=1 Tax=Patagioenas fasciata monilis TaxID=372326 RepID=A0A1V4KSU4_PATFA|nr:hypothetical protein AV530_001006 [Patagioenas fasciata monilis]